MLTLSRSGCQNKVLVSVCNEPGRSRAVVLRRCVQVSLPEASPRSGSRQTRTQVMKRSRAIVSVVTHRAFPPPYKPTELLSHREEGRPNQTSSALSFLLVQRLRWNQESSDPAERAGNRPRKLLIGREVLWNTSDGDQPSLLRSGAVRGKKNSSKITRLCLRR